MTDMRCGSYVLLVLCVICPYLRIINFILFFFFKQKTAYDWRIVDWSSDVCSSDLMLDALAMILADELLDLALVVLAFVQGDADRPVGRDHRLAEQPGRLPLDVEIFLLLEPEQRPIELAPHAHLPAPDIMSQMVEQEIGRAHV